MKKLTLLLAITITAALFTSSCKKECDRHDKQNNQVINITMNENTTYTYTLPATNNGGSYTISQQASNYLTSAIDPSIGPNGTIYTYVPALNFVGSDKVVLSTSNSQHGSGCNGNHNGNCNNGGNHCNGHDNDDDNTITINITVVKVIVTSTKVHEIGATIIPAF